MSLIIRGSTRDTNTHNRPDYHHSWTFLHSSARRADLVTRKSRAMNRREQVRAARRRLYTMCRIHIHFFSALDNEVLLRQRMLAFTYRYQIVACIFTTESVRQLICIRVSMIVRCSSSSSSRKLFLFSLSAAARQ
ncbi:unnamed protein product [Trichogramma brassicae]|uniref:Uncharacterized protein n=1 Tax=Trichogramma brassicae TaxID=86971 RepID=A0A6H5J2S1_9HYME|nr:unnamed protein product [Trichogramma brassicae]